MKPGRRRRASSQEMDWMPTSTTNPTSAPEWPLPSDQLDDACTPPRSRIPSYAEALAGTSSDIIVPPPSYQPNTTPPGSRTPSYVEALAGRRTDTSSNTNAPQISGVSKVSDASHMSEALNPSHAETLASTPKQPQEKRQIQILRSRRNQRSGQAQQSSESQPSDQSKPSDQIQPSTNRLTVPEIRIDPPAHSSPVPLSTQILNEAATKEPTVLPATHTSGLGAVICTPIDHENGNNTVVYQEVRQMLGPYPGGISADIPLAKALGLLIRFKQPTVCPSQDLGANPDDLLHHARVVENNGAIKKHGKYDDIKNEIIADLGMVVDPNSKFFGCVDERAKVFSDRKGQIMFWRADGLDFHPEHLDALMSYMKYYLQPLSRKLRRLRMKPEERQALKEDILAKLTPEAFARGFEAIRKWRIRTDDDFCDWVAARNPITGEYWAELDDGEGWAAVMQRDVDEPDFEGLEAKEREVEMELGAVSGSAALLKGAIAKVQLREAKAEGEAKAKGKAKENMIPAAVARLKQGAAPTFRSPQVGPKRERSMSTTSSTRARKHRPGVRVWDAAAAIEEQGQGYFSPDLTKGMDLG